MVVQLFWFMGFPLIKNWLFFLSAFQRVKWLRNSVYRMWEGSQNMWCFLFLYSFSLPNESSKGLNDFLSVPEPRSERATPELLQWLPQFLLHRLLRCQGSHSGPASALLQEGLHVTCHQALSCATSPLSCKPCNSVSVQRTDPRSPSPNHEGSFSKVFWEAADKNLSFPFALFIFLLVPG